MDKHALIAAAYNEGQTMKQCAKNFGCAVGTVRHALTKHGIETRSRAYRSGEHENAGREKCSPSRKPFPMPQPERKKHYPVRDEILQYAIVACNKCGGIATIDGRYAIVDTKIATVEMK